MCRPHRVGGELELEQIPIKFDSNHAFSHSCLLAERPGISKQDHINDVRPGHIIRSVQSSVRQLKPLEVMRGLRIGGENDQGDLNFTVHTYTHTRTHTHTLCHLTMGELSGALDRCSIQ